MKRLVFVLLAALAAPLGAQEIDFRPAVASGSSTDLTAATTLGTAYGADMVTNGTFTGNATGWTLGLGGGAPDWAYSSNTVTHANGGGTATLEPSTPLTVVAGRTYRITFTLSALTAGTVTASIGGASATAASKDGTFVQEIVAVDTTNLKFTPTTTLVATLDTVSVLESKSVTIANLTSGRIPIVTTGGLLTDSAAFLADPSGGGNHVFTLRRTPSGGSTASNFINSTGTFPAGASSGTRGAYFKYTTTGTSVQAIDGVRIELLSGIASTASAFGLTVFNSAAGQNAGTSYASGGNFGAYISTTGTGSVVRNTGVFSITSGAGTINTAVLGEATLSTGSPLVNIGGAFYALNGSAKNVAVFGGLYGSEYYSASAPALPITSAAFFTNGTVAAPILIATDNLAELPTTGAAAIWAVLDGAWPQLGNGVLTSGTATAETQARDSGSMIHSCTWTNAQVAALGATTAGDISCFTLPAKTVVKNAYLVITGAAGTVTTLTAAVGRTSAAYIDYIVASDAKAAANTVYGDASAERGTNLTGYDLPSYTGTTAVNIHFISTGGNLSTVTASTGRVILETSLVP